MKSFGLAHLFLIFSYLALGSVIVVSYHFFPQPLATHFDLHGHPNGWMTRNENAAFLGFMGLLIPPLVIFQCYRKLRHSKVRFNWGFGRAYRVRPEYLDEVREFLFYLGLWLSGLALLFLAGAQIAVLLSNRTPGHPHLNGEFFVALIAVFILGNIVVIMQTLAYLKALQQAGKCTEVSSGAEPS